METFKIEKRKIVSLSYNFILYVITFLYVSKAHSQLIITGLGDPDGGSGDALELYAVSDIVDLSIYGIGVASNANGYPTTPNKSTDLSIALGVASASAGEFFYLTSDIEDFNRFFAFIGSGIPTAVASQDIGLDINGNDAVILYQLSGGSWSVVDASLADADDTDIHGDGWIYRNNGEGPNTTFASSEWTIHRDVLGNSNSESNSTDPVMPLGTYSTGISSVLTISNDAKASDPCSCQLDAEGLATIGWFEETVTITSMTSGEDWRVVFLVPLQPGGTTPRNIDDSVITTGDTGTQFTDNSDDTYEFTFEHRDLDGYIMTVERQSDQLQLTIYNICEIPTISIALDDIYTNKDDDITLGSSILTISGSGTPASDTPAFSLNSSTNTITGIDFNTITDDTTTGLINGISSPYTLTAEYRLDSYGTGKDGQLGSPASPANACPVRDSHTFTVHPGSLTITAGAVCTTDGSTEVTEGQYYIEVTGVNGSGLTNETVVLTASGVSNQNFVIGTNGASSPVYLGPFTYVNGTARVELSGFIVSPAVCLGTVNVLEAICLNLDHSADGSIDFIDVSGAEPYRAICSGLGTILAPADPAAIPENTIQYYILTENGDTDRDGTGYEAIAWNTTGLFENLSSGLYTVESFNVSTSDSDGNTTNDHTEFEASLGSSPFIDGTTFTSLSLEPSGTAICDATCSADYLVTCCNANADDINLPIVSLSDGNTDDDVVTICVGTDIGIFTLDGYTESDETDPNSVMADQHTNAFILADAAGAILQYNTSGNFNFSVLKEGTYDIFTLNYWTLNSPSDVMIYLAMKAAGTGNDIEDIVKDDNDNTSYGLSNNDTQISDPSSYGTYCIDLDQNTNNDNTDADDGDKVQVVIRSMNVMTTNPIAICSSLSSIDLSSYVTAINIINGTNGTTVSSSYTGAAGNSTALTDFLAGESGSTIMWTALSGGTVSAAGVFNPVSGATTASAMLTLTDGTTSNGCSGTATFEISIRLVDCGTFPWNGN